MLLNSSVFTGDVDRSAHHVVDVPATELAAEAGHVMAATMVMAGAYAATTGLVSVESLVASAAGALPVYRSQHRNSRRESDPGRRRCRAHGRADGLAVAGGAQMTPPLIRGTVVIDVEACKGCRPVHRRLPALRPGHDPTRQVNARGYQYPLLLPGCTACQACAQVCPDFVFQVYKYDTPIELAAR